MPLETKMFEVRDRMTFIPVVATKLRRKKASEMTDVTWDDVPDIMEQYLLGRAGWGPGQDLVLYTPLTGLESNIDPHKWGHVTNRTHFNAHKYIAENFDDLASGSVIDVEFILGEVEEPKESEYFNTYRV